MYSTNTMIEFARISDLVEIGDISRKYIEHDLAWNYTPEKLARLLKSDKKNLVVARSGTQLVGFGMMTYYAEHANLDLLAVKFRHRYQGIGRQLVEWLEKVALTAGTFTVYVQVRKMNAGALKFYHTLGYTIIGERQGYYQGQEAGIMLAKNLRKTLLTK